MLRNATKFSRHRLLELQILRHSNGQPNALRKYMSSKPSSSKGFGLGKLFGSLAVITGATLSYAKYDPEFREWLDKEIPYSSDTISILFQEKQTYSDRFSSFMEDSQKWINDLFSSSSDPPLSPMKAVATVPPSAPIVKEKVVAPTEKPAEKPKTEGVITSNTRTTTAPQKLIDLEAEISKKASLAVESYSKAVHSIRDQARYVQELVMSDIERLPPDLWPTIKKKSEIRHELMAAAEHNARVVEEKMQELEKLVSTGELQASATALEQVRQNVKRIKSDIDSACQKAQEESFKSSVSKTCWPRVQEARKHWREEILTLFPGLDLDEDRLNIAVDEISQFVLYSYINVQYYQKELAKIELNAEKRLREALDKTASDGDSSSLIKAAVEEELGSEKRALDLKYQRRSMELLGSCEQEVRKQLRLQTEIQSDHLRDSIKLREMELEKTHRRKLNEVLTEENSKYQMQLAALVGRIRGIDEGLKAHAQIDKSAQQAQDLWTACQILHRNIDSQLGNVEMRPLAPEVSSIMKVAGEKDELVNLALKGMPVEAVSRGVFSLKVLKERFLKVEKVARTLAIVPEDGSPLPLYLLSWIQGKLIWSSSQPITQAELEDQPTAHEHLNNYDLLSRARYWVDRGDLAQALRYMNLLNGASKSIALDWMNEVRIYLETQQAASVLVTHASAKGLTYA